MKRTDIGVKSGIIWTFTESLGNLDFADDISLLAHNNRDIQSKTEKLVRNAAKVGLHVNKDKTKTMRNNCQTADPVKLGEQDIEDVTEFTYLGAKVTTDGNTEAEIKTRINKARGAFAALKNIWKTKMISKKTKIRIFKSNVLSVLLYAAESWKVTKGICHMLEIFQNKCLRRILHIFWPNKITNADAARLVRSKEKKMEVDWPRKQNATDIYSKNSHALDPRRKQEEGTTKRDVEKVRGARDEGSRVELGPGRKAGSGQNTMAFLDVGLMCEHARSGLSK